MSRDEYPSYYAYWGKTDRTDDEQTRYHLLAYHCLDVAAVGRRLFERDPLLRDRLVSLVGIPADTLVPIATFFLAVHDIGKFSDRFQGLVPNTMHLLSGRRGGRAYRPAMHHSTMGYALWEAEVWPICEDHARNDGPVPAAFSQNGRRYWRPWFSSVTGHHGAPPDGYVEQAELPDLFCREDREAAAALVREMCRLHLPAGGLSIGQGRSLREALVLSSWFLAGLAVLADWIGSSDTFSFREEAMPLEEYWRTVALPQADAALDRAEILPVRPSRAGGLAALTGTSFEPTPLQRYVEACPLGPEPEVFILEDATGSGKTEAALVLAHRLIVAGHAEGLFMGMPTMATANAMYARFGDLYRRFFDDAGSPSLLLTHGRARLARAPLGSISFRPALGGAAGPSEERLAMIACSAWLAENRKRALLAHVGVGTIDQALIAVLPIRHQSLRLLGLARSVLIVDEVHAYDSYVHKLLCALLYFHAAFGGTAILLSATLPARQRQELIDSFRMGRGRGETASLTHRAPYPLVTRSGAETPEEVPAGVRALCRREVEVVFVHSVEAVLEIIDEAVRAGRCACWIRNTVRDAMDGYRSVEARFHPDRARVFHARYVDGDRFEREADIVHLFGIGGTEEARAGQLLVATQVVEQSLDIDFDYMVSDLAPIDLLLQRAGRLHRHARAYRRHGPRLIILSPPLTMHPDEEWYSRLFPRAAFVYPRHGQLWLTALLLAQAGGFRIPDDARRLIEGVYGTEAQATIPEPLMASEARADGKESGDRSMAIFTALSPLVGYERGPEGAWPEEDGASTRLGEPSTELTLARWNGADLLPWIGGDFGWELSRMVVPARIVGGEAPRDAPLARAIERLQRRYPHLGQTTVLIPLRDGGDTWVADARAANGTLIRVLYDAVLGFRVE
jgi:CRISPR-associated endonuclease/helicase Cas3